MGYLCEFQMGEEPTTHKEVIDIVCSLKLASRAPFREYTHSSWSAANTKQLLPFASSRMCEDQVFSVKGKDSTCWTKMRSNLKIYKLKTNFKRKKYIFEPQKLHSRSSSFTILSTFFQSICLTYIYFNFPMFA